ncbi:hypothetical protein Pst134EA_011740 [Puccinia striiformis f. sp. tritici]|uniref:hypothetical protein n=1 Tax=Puccinia striiformis f. sp. tritici TaxID=168172 RepID=UPI0020083C89|nr:hypothetical protein Pst134EA_011740 [Puccinia striiformis f. sp. tritici]KAH9468119.1 hypothetical protein Pst134EA_011740 [Puccinia striiformis f. sp. tritici]
MWQFKSDASTSAKLLGHLRWLLVPAPGPLQRRSVRAAEISSGHKLGWRCPADLISAVPHASNIRLMQFQVFFENPTIQTIYSTLP